MAASPPIPTQVVFAITGAGGFTSYAPYRPSSGNDVAFFIAGATYLTGEVLTLDQFYILSFTYNPAGAGPSAGRAKIWIGGQLVLDEPHSDSTETSADIWVGAEDGSPGNAFKGDIAALAFYHNAISEASIVQVEEYFADLYDLTLA